MRFVSRHIAVLLFSFFVSASLLAQSTGTIKGQVTDPTGAVVTDATINAKSANGQTATATTNKQGAYEIKGLPPGKYDISVAAKGFSKYATQDLTVEPGKAQQLDIELSIAVKSEQVNVEDTNTQVDVSAANNAGSIVLKGKDLDALSDDPDDLASDLQALAGPSAGPNGGQIYIDGFTGGTLPPKSSIREVRINSNPFSAEYDRIGFGRIEILTKPGTDKFHGQGMFNFNNEIFNARNPFNHGVQPGYQTEMYHFNVSGPLNKKSSFFVSGMRQKRDETSIINAVILDNDFNEVPYSTAIPNPVTMIDLSPRLDYQLTKNNTLSTRYSFQRREIENGGISTFTLPSLANNSLNTEHSFQVTDSHIITPTAINDIRFRYERDNNSQRALTLSPTISVPGSFTGGGSGSGISDSHTDNFEFQNSTRMTRGRHLVTFGGRLRSERDSNESTSGYNGSFSFDSLAAYQITARGLSQGLTAAQIRAAGGGASQFRITTGTPLVAVSQTDAGIYAEDTWSVRPNLTLTSGLRFETQNNIDNHFNFAPRIGIAWGIGKSKGTPKTVLRLGGGIFYDRFSQNLVMQARRLNGVTQQNFIVTNPDFYPNVPPTSTLSGTLTSPTTYRIAPGLHAPYVIQSAATLERQIAKTATLSVTYLHSAGRQQLLTHNINAPLPGTYTGPGTGVRPLGGNANVYEYFSGGTFKQEQIITQTNIRISTKVSLNSFYMLSWANGSNSGANSFPVNQYSLAGEYGRTAFDVRQRFFIGGNLTAPWGVRLNPFISISSAPPFNISLGRDLNGDSVYNDRPTFATDLARASVVRTQWGAFDLSPLPGQAVIPVNYGTGFNNVSVNMRISKTFGFGSLPGEKKTASNQGDAGRQGAGGGGPRGGGGGGDHGPGGMVMGGGMIRMGGPGGPFGGGGGPAKRYNLTLSLNANNVLNHVNRSAPVGNLTSPLFGTSNSLAGFGGFGGGGGQAANRRVSLQLQFAF